MRPFILALSLLATGAVAGPFKPRNLSTVTALEPTTTVAPPTEEPTTVATLEPPTSTMTNSSSTSAAAVSTTLSSELPTETLANPCVLVASGGADALVIDAKPCYCRCYISTCQSVTTDEAEYLRCLKVRDWWKASESKLDYWFPALSSWGACVGVSTRVHFLTVRDVVGN
ncbi:hypothetical protein QBC42DRAFT_281878 [Cladorrhinum samala]|uniref:Uncharacterized protein n=1 Tax=Cladorrhinum samala TaxID=585594 RepID=A0AAV9I0Z3_9PEZI|nr:hypothetical protein QBC42DRAFT_281878 [Cladorrhinum samala]